MLVTIVFAFSGSSYAQSNTRSNQLGLQTQAQTQNQGQNQGQAAADNTENVVYSGYCPVTLKEKKQWIPGDPAIAANFDGRIYRFVGAAERERFIADPLNHVPALGGDCIVVWADLKKRAPGNLNYGVFHGGRYYFFATTEQRDKFRGSPETYENSDLAFNGLCPVTRLDAGRDVIGKPELVYLYNDLRYYFSSEENRRKFIASPNGYSETPRVEPNPLGLGGYCPVYIRLKREWVEGRETATVNFDGMRYWLADDTAKAAFIADPAAFAPVLSGDCVVTLANSGVRKPGSEYHSAFYQNRLFLFPSDIEKAAFKLNPAAYAVADIAYGGKCAVCIVDLRSDVDGRPEISSLHRGVRYFFPDEAKRKVFMANPQRYEVKPQGG